MPVGTYEGLFNTIREKFGVDVEDVLSLPVQYDNQPPIDSPGRNAWAAFSIFPGEAEQAELGVSPVTFRQFGFARVIISTPASDDVEGGEGPALAIADAIMDAFRSTIATDVRYQVPSMTRRGRVDNWWRVEVDLPFRFDFVK